MTSKMMTMLLLLLLMMMMMIMTKNYCPYYSVLCWAPVMVTMTMTWLSQDNLAPLLCLDGGLHPPWKHRGRRWKTSPKLKFQRENRKIYWSYRSTCTTSSLFTIATHSLTLSFTHPLTHSLTDEWMKGSTRKVTSTTANMQAVSAVALIFSAYVTYIMFRRCLRHGASMLYFRRLFPVIFFFLLSG